MYCFTIERGAPPTDPAKYEPSRRPIGAFTRAGADHIRGRALACLVAADRFKHQDAEIRPARAAGMTVVCDRYLASSLVLQRLDRVPLKFLLHLAEGVDLPDLAVILTADPDLINDRLAERGAHHRFETDPGNPRRELDLYQEAAGILTKMGVAVLTLDTGVLTPLCAAARIAAELAWESR